MNITPWLFLKLNNVSVVCFIICKVVKKYPESDFFVRSLSLISYFMLRDKCRNKRLKSLNSFLTMWCCQRGDVFLWESCEVFRTGVVPSWELKWGPRMKMPVSLLTVLTMIAPLINGFYQGKSLFSCRWCGVCLVLWVFFNFFLSPPALDHE